MQIKDLWIIHVTFELIKHVSLMTIMRWLSMVTMKLLLMQTIDKHQPNELRFIQTNLNNANQLGTCKPPSGKAYAGTWDIHACIYLQNINIEIIKVWYAC